MMRINSLLLTAITTFAIIATHSTKFLPICWLFATRVVILLFAEDVVKSIPSVHPYAASILDVMKWILFGIIGTIMVSLQFGVDLSGINFYADMGEITFIAVPCIFIRTFQSGRQFLVSGRELIRILIQ
jgi:hypothetical protein